MSLRYPLPARVAGSAAGWVVYLAARLLFVLPDSLLAVVFGLAAALVKLVVGEGPAYRAVADLAYVFGKDRAAARVFRRLLTECRPPEIIYIVRGAVARSVSW